MFVKRLLSLSWSSRVTWCWRHREAKRHSTK